MLLVPGSYHQTLPQVQLTEEMSPDPLIPPLNSTQDPTLPRKNVTVSHVHIHERLRANFLVLATINGPHEGEPKDKPLPNSQCRQMSPRALCRYQMGVTRTPWKTSMTEGLGATFCSRNTPATPQPMPWPLARQGRPSICNPTATPAEEPCGPCVLIPPIWKDPGTWGFSTSTTSQPFQVLTQHSLEARGSCPCTLAQHSARWPAHRTRPGTHQKRCPVSIPPSLLPQSCGQPHLSPRHTYTLPSPGQVPRCLTR